MAGVFPNTSAGGALVRDLSGVCLSPVNVENAYCPPPQYGVSCELTALPNTCAAQITPRQINAIVSEMLCFASSLSPTGTWNCGNLCNISSSFSQWQNDVSNSSGSFLRTMQTQLCGRPLTATPWASLTNPAFMICDGAGNILRYKIPDDLVGSAGSTGGFVNGLSLGQVNKPSGNPAQTADISGSDPRLGVSYASMGQLFTNRAAQVGGGMMNADGSLGYHHILRGNVSSALGANGAFLQLTLANASITAIPAPAYDGHTLRVFVSGLGATGNAQLTGSFSGIFRKTTGIIEAGSATTMVVRNEESVVMIGSGATWVVSDFNAPSTMIWSTVNW
jgi:hypothetical protein